MTDSCKINSDCGRLNECDLDDGTCTHEDLFSSLGIEIIAYVLMGILLGLQNIGGLGAGTIKVFVFMMILNYSVKQSTSYTYPVLFGSKIADNIMAYRRKHPIFTSKPLIDFDIVLIFLPSVLLGSVMGAVFNPLAPNLFLQFILIFFISLSLITTIKKVKKQWELKKQEREKAKQQKQSNAAQEDNANQNEQTGQNKIEDQEKSSLEKSHSSQNKEQKPDLFLKKSAQANDIVEVENKTPHHDIQNKSSSDQNQQVNINISKEDQQGVSQIILDKYKKLIQQSQQVPKLKVSIIICIFLMMLLYYALLGGKGGDSIVGIENCSYQYWILFSVQFLIYLTLFIAIAKLIKGEEKIKSVANHVYQTYETSISKLGLYRFILNGFLSGFVNGLVGFGGSLMIVPIMVVLGLHPRAATASTSFLIIFSSGISVIISLFGGQTSLSVFGILFGMSFVGSMTFTYIFNKIVDYYKLANFTIAFTAIVQFLLLSSSVILFIISLVQNPFKDQLKTKDYC